MKMMRDKNMTRQRTLPLVVIVMTVGFAVYFWGGFIVVACYADRMRVRLLCKTDHRALLEACRELSRRASIGELRTGPYRVVFFAEAPSYRGSLNPSWIFGQLLSTLTLPGA